MMFLAVLDGIKENGRLIAVDCLNCTDGFATGMIGLRFERFNSYRFLEILEYYLEGRVLWKAIHNEDFKNLLILYPQLNL